MRKFLAGSRTTVIGIAVVAVLSVAGIATANRAIRDGTVNTRDIKDNQVNTRDIRNNTVTTRDIRDNQINTRDLRDGAIRGVDVRDGSIELADLSAEAATLAGSATLFDPRAHGASGCCLSWARGPEEITAVVPASGDPIPDQSSGQAWRSAVLDPGTYLVQTSGTASAVATGAEGAATRLFLAGKPVGEGGSYAFFPVSATALPEQRSSATVVEVGNGDPGQRTLAQRAVSLGASARLADNLLVWRVTPR